MAYVISEACTNCGACESECIVSAIKQVDSTAKIDADACVECGACAGVCPVNAISQP